MDRLQSKSASYMKFNLVLLCGFMLFSTGCKKEDAIDETQFLMMTWCAQTAYTPPKPVTANEIKLFPSGSIVAAYNRSASYETNSKEEVTLAFSKDGINFSNRTPASPLKGGYTFGYSFQSEAAMYATNGETVTYKTSDSGASWSPMKFEPSYFGPIYFGPKLTGYYKAVLFADSLNGIRRGSLYTASYGSENFLDRTADGGESWIRYPIDQQTAVYDLVMFSASEIVYSASNSGSKMSVFRSTNGGANFNATNAPTSYRSKLFFSDSLNGWVAAANSLGKTTDGGATWTTVTHNLTGGSFSKVKFLTANDGYSLYGLDYTPTKLYKTIDGGANWTLISLPFASNGIEGTFDAVTGKIAVSHQNKLYVSTNEFAAYSTLDLGLTKHSYAYSNAVGNMACMPYSL
ncbi:WD40/YVTN/BNR-like repeat-containing protein [Leptospira yasudae]|uniref:WD40/YVTN/BNR-like repeat-containing protein n=1 Tax=Leptospira yasudae TaxID=2202201 RepID=UPI001FED7338|nr:hypothetical protein [Leptospira yasudae]